MRLVPSLCITPLLLFAGCSVDWSIPHRADAGDLDGEAWSGDTGTELAAVDGDGGAQGSGPTDGAEPDPNPCTVDVDSADCLEQSSGGVHCAQEGATPPCECTDGWADDTCSSRVSVALGQVRLSAGTVWPEFSSDTLKYRIFVGVGDSSISITPELATPQFAAVAVNGTAVESGTAVELTGISLFESTVAQLDVTTSTGATRNYEFEIVRSAVRRAELWTNGDSAGFGGIQSFTGLQEAAWPRVGALALHDDVLAVGSPQSGPVRLFARDLGRWTPVPGASVVDRPSTGVTDFGATLAMNDKWLAIGAPHLIPSADGLWYTGNVYLVPRAGAGVDVSKMTTLRTVVTDVFDYFGGALALDGDTLIVGSPAENVLLGNTQDSSYGTVYVYQYDGTRWQSVQRLFTPEAEVNGLFGDRVALQGELLVVADSGVAVGSSDNWGAVHVYRLTQGKFVHEQTLTLTPPAGEYHEFATAVAISESRIAVAEQRDCLNSCRGTPRVHIYERRGSAWQETGVAELPGNPTAATTTDPRDFGNTGFAFHGRTLLVTAIDDARSSQGISQPALSPAAASAPRYGTVHVFDELADGWHSSARIGSIPTGSKGSGGFGRDLLLHGNSLFVVSTEDGANYAADTTHYGRIHVYGLDCTRVTTGADPDC